MANPFNPRYPADPKYFVGRKEILRGLERDFRYSLTSKPPKPENVAITGEWGIGKTSTLNKLFDIVFKEKRVLPIFISLTTYRDLGSFVKDFVNKIHRAIEESKSIPAKTKDDLFSWKIKSLRLGPVSVEKDIKEFTGLSPSEQLRSSLIDLWKNYLGKEFDLVILMLDDFHWVVRIAEESLYDIRAIFQELPNYGCNYQLVITGTSDMFGRIRSLAEPLVRFFGKYELLPFTYEETKEAINLPLRLEGIHIKVKEDVVKKIYSLTQGHPFFISFIMRDLVELRGEGEIDSRFFKDNYSEVFNHLRYDKFEKELDSVSDNERRVLLKVSRLTDETIRPTQVEAEVKNGRVYLASLVDKDLIVKLRRGRYKLYHPLFKEYLRLLKEGNSDGQDE